MASPLRVPPPPAAAVGASSSTSSVLRQPTGPGYTTATTLDRGVAAMRGFNATLVQGTLHLSVNEHCAVAVGAAKEALEASKAVLLAAQGAVKAAEEAVAAAAEA